MFMNTTKVWYVLWSNVSHGFDTVHFLLVKSFLLFLLIGMQTYPATYTSETEVTCDVDLDGIQAPASLPVYVTPQAKPLSNRRAIAKYVASVSSTSSSDLIIGASAPQLEECQFDSSMLMVI